MDYIVQARLRDLACEIEQAAAFLFHEPLESDQLEVIAEALVDYAAELGHAR